MYERAVGSLNKIGVPTAELLTEAPKNKRRKLLKCRDCETEYLLPDSAYNTECEECGGLLVYKTKYTLGNLQSLLLGVTVLIFGILLVQFYYTGAFTSGYEGFGLNPGGLFGLIAYGIVLAGCVGIFFGIIPLGQITEDDIEDDYFDEE